MPWCIRRYESILNVGFISTIYYPYWLANIVLTTNKNGSIHVCIYLYYFFAVSHKEYFPLYSIDPLVDSYIGYEIMYLMDGFFGYNQIMITYEDHLKTSFQQEWGTI